MPLPEMRLSTMTLPETFGGGMGVDAHSGFPLCAVIADDPVVVRGRPGTERTCRRRRRVASETLSMTRLS